MIFTDPIGKALGGYQHSIPCMVNINMNENPNPPAMPGEKSTRKRWNIVIKASYHIIKLGVVSQLKR